MKHIEIIKEIKSIGKLWDSDIAKLIGVSEHSVNMWFNGRTKPKECYVAKLENLLNDINSYIANGGSICCHIKAMEVLNARLQDND